MVTTFAVCASTVRTTGTSPAPTRARDTIKLTWSNPGVLSLRADKQERRGDTVLVQREVNIKHTRCQAPQQASRAGGITLARCGGCKRSTPRFQFPDSA